MIVGKTTNYTYMVQTRENVNVLNQEMKLSGIISSTFPEIALIIKKLLRREVTSSSCRILSRQILRARVYIFNIMNTTATNDLIKNRPKRNIKRTIKSTVD